MAYNNSIVSVCWVLVSLLAVVLAVWSSWLGFGAYLANSGFPYWVVYPLIAIATSVVTGFTIIGVIAVMPVSN